MVFHKFIVNRFGIIFISLSLVIEFSKGIKSGPFNKEKKKWNYWNQSCHQFLKN
jgi:hypothetical protein